MKLELPQEVQVKLLRVIQEKEIEFSISNLSIKGYNLKDIIQERDEEIIDDAMRRYGNIRMASKAL